ncbi:MAG: hypothetical protein RLZZ398_2087 [Verrucomicrobiota bacterium]|jgi:alpha-L-fucosidase 2
MALRLITLSLAISIHAGAAGKAELWYQQPATKWAEALPIGNGHMGAMIYGGIAEEQIQFNESTVWTGKPHEYQHEGAVKFLPILRDLCNQSRQLDIQADQFSKDNNQTAANEKRNEAKAKQKQAEDIGRKEFISVPLGQKTYQPFGDLRLSFPSPSLSIKIPAMGKKTLNP